MKDRIISKYTVMNPAIRDDPGLSEILTKILNEALTEHEEMLQTVLERRAEKAAKRAAEEAAKAAPAAAPTAPAAVTPVAAADDGSKEIIEKQQKEIDALLTRINALESESNSAPQPIPEDASEQEKIITNLRKKVQKQREENKVWKEECAYWEGKHKAALREGLVSGDAQHKAVETSSNDSGDSDGEDGDSEKIITNLRNKVKKQREEIKVWKEECGYWEEKCKNLMRGGIDTSESGDEKEEVKEAPAPETPAKSSAITLDDLVMAGRK